VDPSAAAKAIGWRPEVAVAAGLARTFEWFKARR
jgi:UDP-glucose 4-epimerase